MPLLSKLSVVVASGEGDAIMGLSAQPASASASLSSPSTRPVGSGHRTYVSNAPKTALRPLSTGSAPNARSNDAPLELQEIVVVEHVPIITDSAMTTATEPAPVAVRLQFWDYLRLALVAVVCFVIGELMYVYGNKQEPVFVRATAEHPSFVYMEPTYPILHDLIPFAYCICDLAFAVVAGFIVLHMVPMSLKRAWARLDEVTAPHV